jgi:hypothetical protein
MHVQRVGEGRGRAREREERASRAGGRGEIRKEAATKGGGERAADYEAAWNFPLNDCSVIKMSRNESQSRADGPKHTVRHRFD